MAEMEVIVGFHFEIKDETSVVLSFRQKSQTFRWILGPLGMEQSMAQMRDAG